MSARSRTRAPKLLIAIRLLLLPFQLMLERVSDLMFTSFGVSGVRVMTEPGLSQDERDVLARKLQAAFDTLREADESSAQTFFAHFKKLYLVPSQSFGASSSGMPRLPRRAVLTNAPDIVASFLIQYVPTAHFGLIKSGYQLVDPVRVQLHQREIQIKFLRERQRVDSATTEYIVALERDLSELRAQL